MVETTDLEALKRYYAELASAQPTREGQAAADLAQKEIRKAARKRFIESVEMGAKAAAMALDELGVGGSFYSNSDMYQDPGQSFDSVEAYVFGKHWKYGGNTDERFRVFIDSNAGEYGYYGRNRTSESSRQLAVARKSGALLIVGTYGSSPLVDTESPASSDWFHEDAVQTPDDAEKLIQEVQGDIKTMVEIYSRRR